MRIESPGDRSAKTTRGTLFVALAEEQVESRVSQGENSGHVLQHVAVTRVLKSAGTIDLRGPSVTEFAIPLLPQWEPRVCGSWPSSKTPSRDMCSAPRLRRSSHKKESSAKIGLLCGPVAWRFSAPQTVRVGTDGLRQFWQLLRSARSDWNNAPRPARLPPIRRPFCHAFRAMLTR